MLQRAKRWLLVGLILILAHISLGCANRTDREDYYSRETIHRDSFPETYGRDAWDGPVTYGRY